MGMRMVLPKRKASERKEAKERERERERDWVPAGGKRI